MNSDPANEVILSEFVEEEPVSEIEMPLLERFLTRFDYEVNAPNLVAVAAFVDANVTFEMNENQRAAIISYASCLRLEAFKNSKVLELLNTGNPDGAATELAADVTDNGRWSFSRFQRRLHERDMFRGVNLS